MSEVIYLSIVVLSYNSDKTIKQCLDALFKLDYPKESFEVIVMDNGSTDNTTKIVDEYDVRKYCYPSMNISQLRNKGVEHSNGAVVGFVDSDCVVDQQWAHEGTKWFKDPDVGIVSNYCSLPADASFFERNWHAKPDFGVKNITNLGAANMLVSKKHFNKLGGFDSSLDTGEDAYLLKIFQNAGIKTILDSKLKSIHLENSKNLRMFFRKEVWHGIGMLGTVDSRGIDKPFMFANIFLILLVTWVISIIGVLFFHWQYSALWLLAQPGIMLSISFLAAYERVFKKKNKGNLIYVTIVYFVYGLARMTSLIYIYKLAKYKKKKKK